MSLAPPVADPAHRRARLRSAAFAVGACLTIASCAGDEANTIEPTRATGTNTVAQVETTIEPAAETTAVPVVVGETEPVDAGVQPEGVTTATVRITEDDGEVCDVCVWLADTSEERARGLMGVTDLGDAVGMLFVFGSPALRSFYMFQTPTPLSIAWFAEDGLFVESTEMSPCLDVAAADCPRYAPGSRYQTALEVFEGGLDELGVGPGARIEVLTAGCDSPSS